MRQKVYCGNQPQPPQGYDRIGSPFQCLRKGYGVCLYNGRQGQRFQRPPVNTNGTRPSFLWSTFHYLSIFLSLVILFLLVFGVVYYFLKR